MPINLFPYQEQGAAWLAQRDRAGLHDEMGVGKTATLIRALDLVGAERGVIIVPAMLRENWIKEFRRFSHRNLRLCKGANIHDYVAWERGRFHFLITSYEQATKWAPRIMENGEFLDAVVMDESHYLKNTNTARTKAILGPEATGEGGIVGWAQYSWTASGTPIPNDPVDIFPFLRFTQCMPLTKNAFMKRYFTSRRSTYGTKQTCRPGLVDELRALIENNAIRRTKRDIGMQLPPIFLTPLFVDGDSTEIRTMLAEHPGLEQAIISAVEQGGLSFLDAQHIATLRRLVGQAKVIPYSRMLLDELMSGATDKRVVMGIHHDALRQLRDFLARKGIHAVLVNGDTPEKQRIAAVEAFQTDPNCRVFIGNIRAAGTGLTLTASCELDLLESDWTPAGNAQAIMRVHRIGQTRNVTARFITLASSIDEVVNKIVAEKTAAIAEIEGEAMHAAPS